MSYTLEFRGGQSYIKYYMGTFHVVLIVLEAPIVPLLETEKRAPVNDVASGKFERLQLDGNFTLMCAFPYLPSYQLYANWCGAQYYE